MKKYDCSGSIISGRILLKYLLLMKLAAFLILAFSFQSFAIPGFSQKRISLDLKNISIPDVLKKIESDYDYRFVYNDEVKRTNIKFDIYAKKATIDYVMEKLLLNTTFSYKKINDGLVVIIGSANDKIIMPPVMGKILNEGGEPLSGVSIVEKGTSNGTTTGENGTFILNVKDENSILVISAVGYVTQEISVKNDRYTNITMVSEVGKMDEVVVIGYGTAKRSDVSSAISSVNTKDLKDMPVTGIDQALQGKVSGVTINNNSGQPGGGVSIVVRGFTSINSNDPLIVIDGVVIGGNNKSSIGALGGAAAGQTSNSFLANINPNDIESVDVLKDASAQAIYGSQAANGVILITTKKGKQGLGKIGYDGYYGIQQIAKTLDVMNLREFAQYQNEIVPLMPTAPTPEFADPSVLGDGTNWQEALFQRGAIQSHQLSFSGGQNKSTYYISAGYFNQKGIVIGSGFKRYTFRMNMENQIKKWLKVGGVVNGTNTIQDIAISDGPEATVWWATVQNPVIPVKNIDGSWGGGDVIGEFSYTMDNPVARTHFRGNQTKYSNYFGSLYGDINILQGLSLRNELSYSFANNNSMSYQTSGRIGQTYLPSSINDARAEYLYWAFRTYLNYNKNIKRSNINATIGHEASYNSSTSITGLKSNLANNILDLNAGDGNKENWALSGGKGESTLESYFARAIYSYGDRYSITATMRADASSRFYGDNKWGFFPGISAAWTLTNEKFLNGIKPVINYMKFRAAYGAVGNQNIPWSAPVPPYTTVMQFWTPYGLGDIAAYQSGVANPDIKWESVITKNIGLDISLLKSRIEANIDLYRKTTSGMIIIGTGPRFLGIGDQWLDLKAPLINAGQMSNTGIDIAVNTTNIKSKNFTWKTNLIFSKFKNKLDELAGDNSGLPGRVYWDRYTVTWTKPGYPVGSFFGLVTDGLFRTQEDLDNSLPQFGYTIDNAHTWLGDVRFKDVSGPNGVPDGIIDANDVTYIGSPIPKFTYGFTNTFNVFNFDISVFLQGSYGAKIYNYLRWRLESLDNPFMNQLRTVMDRYTDENIEGSLPRWTDKNVNNTYVSDRYIEDGSYLRIQNITLGYRLPESLIKKLQINSVRVYASAQNLKTFTKYSGYDPEVGAYNNDIRLMNVDAGRYANPRSFTIGINAEF